MISDLIPVNLFTGFLGVGKTTALLHLLRVKPCHEHWAVLINEYGDVSLDDAILEGDDVAEGVSMRSVAGGCFCCTSAPQLPVALHFLLNDVKPHRLLIETSGLGHTARIIDTIREQYADRLEVRATIGLMTPIDFHAVGLRDSNPIFRDQIALSDVLLLNKLDTAQSNTLEEFQTWAEAMEPPKLLIAATHQGRIDPSWLDLQWQHDRMAIGHEQHTSHSTQSHGAILTPNQVYHLQRLQAFFELHPAIRRAKGIFNTQNGWFVFQRVGPSFTLTPTAYRRDNRYELFWDDQALKPSNWDQLLAACHFDVFGTH